MSVSGSCLCGAFTYSVDASQWSQAGPPALITEFEHQPGLYNAFCAKCGSPLYARSNVDPSDIRVRLGGFEGDLDVTITGHVWTSSKASWYEIEDSIPQFKERHTAP
jgi:hypothetical protein